MISLLFLGDICGPVGRRVVDTYLPELKKRHRVDFVIANGENATHGRGLSLQHYRRLIEAGVDCVTMGNHFYAVGEILRRTDEYERMVRPANFDGSCPGIGTRLFFLASGQAIRVTNLLGYTEIKGAQENPFVALERILRTAEPAAVHLVDFHAEATGEKAALARAFDGRVTAVLGTHTHVQTNDARILPRGTGFLSDVGSCCAYESVLGMVPEPIIKFNSTNMPARFEVPREGRGQLNACLIKLDQNFRAASLELINIIE